MPRHLGFLCNGCHSYVKDEYTDFHLCAYCAGQFRAIWRIYTTICGVRLRARKLSPAQLVARLWEAYQKLYPDEE